MSVTESRWRKRQCPCEDGIYFANDTFTALRGSPSTGYRASIRAPLANLLQTNPEGWLHLDELCSTKADDLTVVAGSTPWEGSGFVALEQPSSERLLWILQLSDAEQFIEVSVEGKTIRAISEQYPFRSEWRIPTGSPETLVVTQVHLSP